MAQESWVELMNLIDGTEENPTPHGGTVPGKPVPEAGGIYKDGTVGTVNELDSVLLMAEEFDDQDLFIARQGIVESNLMKYVDNPSVPTAVEKMEMLESLGGNSNTLWYDKWIAERNLQVKETEELFQEDAVMDIIQNDQMRRARVAVADAFERIELQEIKPKTAMEQLDDAYSDFTLKMSPEEAFKYDNTNNTVPFDSDVATGLLQDQGIELVSMERVEIDGFLELENQAPPISDMALDGLAGDAEIAGWELFPTAEALAESALGLVAGGVGSLALYGLVEGFTPIVKSLINQDWYHYPWETEQRKEIMQEFDEIAQHTVGMGPYWKLKNHISDYLNENPIYIWFYDDESAQTDYRGNDFMWSFMPTVYCTRYWLRARVIYMEGSVLGFEKAPEKLYFLVSLTRGTADMGKNDGRVFWVNASRARILRDNAKVQHALNTLNLRKILFRDIQSPLNDDSEAPPPQDIIQTVEEWTQNNTSNDGNGFFGNNGWGSGFHPNNFNTPSWEDDISVPLFVVPENWTFSQDVYYSPDGYSFVDYRDGKDPVSESQGVPYGMTMQQYARYLVNKHPAPNATTSDWDPRFVRYDKETGEAIYPNRVKGLKAWYKSLGRPTPQVHPDEVKKIETIHVQSDWPFDQMRYKQEQTPPPAPEKPKGRRLVAGQAKLQEKEPEKKDAPPKKETDNTLVWIVGIAAVAYLIANS